MKRNTARQQTRLYKYVMFKARLTFFAGFVACERYICYAVDGEGAN